jgi:CBS domain-containing protein
MTASFSGTVAKDIMSSELIKVRESTSLEEALKLMVNSRITGVPVIDAQDKMIGVLSDFDILQQVSKAERITPDLFKDKVEYSREVTAITEDTPLEDIVDLLIKTRFRRLPVVNSDGNLVGLITRRDLMKVFFYRSRLS